MKSKIFKRIAAFVLVALMAFSIVPVNAFAAGEAGVITFDYCYDSKDYFYAICSLYVIPQFSMDLMIGRMDSPSSVSEYSTRGGTSG